MKENQRNNLWQLENIGDNLLDPTAALAEICNEPQYTPDPAPQLSAEDLDRFDTLSFVIPTPMTEHRNEWNEKLRFLEASLSNGCVWLFDEDRDEEDCAQTYQRLFQTAVDHLNQQQTSQSVEEVLALFDSWAGTPLDILSPYGDIDFNHNIFEDSFEVNVPVSIISQNEEIIVKANMPWIKAQNFKNLDDQAGIQVDLKSVLSLLPVRVNSQEVKVTFENGEFRLEAPRMEEKSPRAQLHKKVQ